MESLFFVLFIVFISGILILDLKYIDKDKHIMSFKEALIWSIVWISLSLAFFVFLRFFGEKIHGISDFQSLNAKISQYASHIKIVEGNYEESIQIYRNYLSITFITGYVIEKTLSVDNIFVMLMILTGFSVKIESYKPVLFWGIFGAIILRCIFIFTGASLVQRFHWILFIFGAFLIYSGVKMYIDRNTDEKIEPQNHFLVKFLSRHLPVFPRYVGDLFFVKKDNKRYITPLFVVLVLIEFSDLVFALDSIPAIFAVTTDPYIVFFSNIFAIIGLRSLFFLFIKIIHKFHFLKIGVAILLVFIGLKLLIGKWLENIGYEPEYSLWFILAVLVGSVVVSLVFPKKDED